MERFAAKKFELEHHNIIQSQEEFQSSNEFNAQYTPSNRNYLARGKTERRKSNAVEQLEVTLIKT